MEQLTPRGRLLYLVYSHFHPRSPYVTHALRDDAEAAQSEGAEPMSIQAIYKRFWPLEDSALDSADKTK